MCSCKTTVATCYTSCRCDCHTISPVNGARVVEVKPPKFWMVKGNGGTSVQHTSLALAMKEAERLARINPNQSFYILEAIDLVKVDLAPVKVTHL